MNRIYSLFLLPEDSVNNKCQKIILDIASSHLTQKFKPHVTLIKNLELKEKEVLDFTNEIIKWLKPIKTKFVEFGYSDRIYRSIYITVLKTSEIIKAHDKANQIFGHKEEPFLPHLAIVYGELALDDKLKIIESLKPLDKEYFMLDKLVVYDITEKNADLWKEVECFDL
jgi:2'-5' RNA ligase